jgi:hypothetical protein
MPEFKNTPSDQTPKGEEKKQQRKRGTEQTNKRNLIWEGIKIACVVVVLGFVLVRVYDVGRVVAKNQKEMWFSYTHPELVKPIRELYDQGHKKTDEDLKTILGVGK